MLNRRDFLKGSAFGLAGITGAIALSGCASSPKAPEGNQDNAVKADAEQPGGAQSSNAPASQSGTAPTAASLHNEEAREVSLVEFEADVAPKVAETKECDIVVLGSGAGGMGAAVKAAQLGAKVILLEKGSELGGSTNGTEGMFGWGSSLQHETDGVELPLVAELIQEELTYSNYRIDAALWNRFINASGKSVDWLRDLGYQFDRVDVYKGQISAFKCYHWWAEEKGATMIAHLADKAKELGVEIITQTPGVALMTENGKVAGVYGHDVANNKYIAVKAKATIVGTGGFGLNNALIEQLTVWDMTYGTTRSTGAGDGVIMAEDVGAGTYMTSILPRTSVEGYTVYDEIAIGCCDNPLLFVNENGDRFMNGEGILSGWRKYKAGAQLPDFQKQLDECLSSKRGNVFKGDTVEDLAKAMGVDPANLKATVDRYNKLCADGFDEDFLKGAEYMIPVQTGPFYAVRQDPSVTNTIGGLDVNYDNAAVNTEGEVIPGLYCVGVDACKLYKETYNYAMSGGLVGYCLYSGLNAAEHACGEVLA